ncbi:hypothetical protein PF010_g31742 [Phytophthora fragariae]|uniref:Uncharacterized protein n=1 Tax=Phytophthora fragariae TaxID=53985 RepID=A0A6G0JGG9_9STRA|nr:hypothetical protein PF010_g31742 [Phytophthora fragariae]
MASIIARLRRERSEQLKEECRPPIDSVDGSTAFIVAESPSPTLNVTLKMCVLRIFETDLNWQVYLIDEELKGDNFEAFVSEYEQLDPARRNKFVFRLTIWKQKNTASAILDYREGMSYTFEKVHSLKMRYDSPQGAMQFVHSCHDSPHDREMVHSCPAAEHEAVSRKQAPKRKSTGDSQVSPMASPAKKSRGS